MISLRHMRFRPADLNRVAGQRHERVDDTRVFLAPHPGLHAAHRKAHYQPQVVDSQFGRHQLMRRVNHVLVVIARKVRVQAITWLGGSPVSDLVRQDQEEPRGVEWLAGAEQVIGEARSEQLLS